MKRIPKIAMLAGILALGHSWTVTAQDKKTAPKESAPAKTAQGKKMADGYTMLPSGLEYKIFKHGTGKHKPVISDHIEINIRVHQGDSVIFDSRKMNDNKVVPLPITAPRYKGDLNEGLMLMVAGDSGVFRLPVDSLKKIGGMLIVLESRADPKTKDCCQVAIRKHNDFRNDLMPVHMRN